MVEELLRSVADWAARRPGVRAAGLVGSHARGEAGPGSDVDLVIVADEPGDLLADGGWAREFGEVARTAIEPYGRVVSLRVWYAEGLEVEFGIAAPSWALEPDEGSLRVVRAGLRALSDPEGLLARLTTA